jgi:hypothetical protein
MYLANVLQKLRPPNGRRIFINSMFSDLEAERDRSKAEGKMKNAGFGGEKG